MKRNRFGKTDVKLSVIGLGGHEFIADGRVKAMGEDFYHSVTPGVIWEGFGGERRRHILDVAYQAGVNFFDLTMDSEKEAFGRNLAEAPPPHPIYIQTRPEGMVYNNIPADEDKARLLDYDLLKAEAERALEMLHRDVIDLYNFGLFPPAVQRQPDYVARLARNVERLKGDGLARFACVDTLSGEAISLAMIETGAFDGVFTNCSVACDRPLERVVPAAVERDMGILFREAFVKGRLFTLGEAAGITDRAGLARASIRWLLSHGVCTSLVVGVAEPGHLEQDVAAAREPALTDEDEALLAALRAVPEFTEFQRAQRDFFVEGFV